MPLGHTVGSFWAAGHRFNWFFAEIPQTEDLLGFPFFALFFITKILASLAALVFHVNIVFYLCVYLN